MKDASVGTIDEYLSGEEDISFNRRGAGYGFAGDIYLVYQGETHKITPVRVDQDKYGIFFDGEKIIGYGPKGTFKKLLKVLKKKEKLTEIRSFFTEQLRLREAGVTGEQLKHTTHLEDLLYFHGEQGAQLLTSALSATVEMLANGVSASELSTKQKWDGSPSAICASNFNGEAFVATKGFFAKTPKLARTQDEVQELFGHQPDLAKKMGLLLSYVRQLQIPEGQVWQGDFLFSKDDLRVDEIDGERVVTFHPNTIVYAVPLDGGAIAKEVQTAEVGIAFHTRYTGSDRESLKISFDVEADELATIPQVFVVDAKIPIEKGMLSEEEAANYQRAIQSISVKNRRLYSFLEELPKHEELVIRLSTFANHLIRTQGRQFIDAGEYVQQFADWVEAAYQKEIDSKKQDKTKERYAAKRDAIIDEIENMWPQLEQLVSLQSSIASLKEELIARLNTLGSFRTFFRTLDQGYIPTGQEGFVVSDAEGNIVKLVSRLEFSKSNWDKNILKGWMSAARMQESAASDAYEHAVAETLDDALSVFGLSAERPAVSTSYADVKLSYKGKEAWLEVKMNHTDQLGNPRVFFKNNAWHTTYKTPVAKFAVDQLNQSDAVNDFIDKLSAYINIPRNKLSLPTTRGGLNEPGAVPLEVLRAFFASEWPSQYILSVEDIDLGDIVTEHYTKGKAEPAYYLQAGDDFYLISSEDPLELQQATEFDIPELEGTGPFKMRVGLRSQFYEIQAELKIKEMLASPYSIKPGSKKPNPFDELVELADKDNT